MIHHTQRPYGKAVGRNERSTSVKTDFRIPTYKRIAGKSRVFQRVGYRENVVAEQGMSAESEIVLDFIQWKAELGFEPAPVLVHDRHQRYWSVAYLRGQECQFVKGGFG